MEYCELMCRTKDLTRGSKNETFVVPDYIMSLAKSLGCDEGRDCSYIEKGCVNEYCEEGCDA